MSVRDPYLDLPLEGVHLIEASAGTGKTWTLATLVARLVVERGLRIGEVLTVTYTEAATQELRKRIRERLQLTLDLIDFADRTRLPLLHLVDRIVPDILDLLIDRAQLVLQVAHIVLRGALRQQEH